MSGGRILILGGSGVIGRALFRCLGPARVILTACRRSDAATIRFDALLDDPGRLIDSQGPLEGVFLMFGVTAPDDCARRPDDARRLNVEAMIRAIEACEIRGLPIVFTSSEVVFDGARGDYGEEDATGPLMLYGRQKLMIEARLSAYRGRAVIARVARVAGAQPNGDALIGSVFNGLLRGDIVPAAVDQRFSPILDDDAARALAALLERKASGVFHVAGPEAVSRLDVAERCRSFLQERGVRTLGRIEARRLADFPTLEPRPRDVSLCIDRMIAVTGHKPANLNAILAAIWERRAERADAAATNQPKWIS